MKGLLFSQAETGSPSFLLSVSSLFPHHHCCVTTHKIHDIYHNSSHPFTWQLEMPSGLAKGLIFVFVFLNFSISVTLRYHWYSQKSALTSHNKHIHITKTHDLFNRLKRSLAWSLVCAKKHLHQYFLLRWHVTTSCSYHWERFVSLSFLLEERHQCGAAVKPVVSLPMDS